MGAPSPPFSVPVQNAFDAFPAHSRAPLQALRAMIFETAADMPEIGPVEETLKWGQPAYITPKTRAATTLRLGVPKTADYALFVPCQSRVILDAQALFGDLFRYEGTRGILFDVGQDPDPNALRQVIRSALRYHLKS
ncbi:DUF1801 domain-containing protein [Cognatishimia sp. F0-27]|uniref:DUF1801 domain-containing protein n=1 Tax=Cognatishimia sp. F0-27 TaxID=2816855 RepID=UPI001D0C13A2|nr:DUF1801 domain-containing protein [Cognatishimia sp. F0-27]MCC1491099.1 DUF1801 domain-containing protein [Cognatishimia sp. F0-27]